jgi:hypothetical protein
MHAVVLYINKAFTQSSTNGVQFYSRMPSSEMLRPVALLKIDVPEESIAYIIRVTRVGELGTTLSVFFFAEFFSC